MTSAAAAVPPALLALVEADFPAGETLSAFVRLYGQALGADRCLLFLYDHERRLSCCAAAWWRLPAFAFRRALGRWRPMEPELAARDPLYAEAVRNPEAVYVEDIDTAPVTMLNRDYERRHFAHRALVHAPLHEKGRLLGILEPCVCEQPRSWTREDRELTSWAQNVLLRPALALVESTRDGREAASEGKRTEPPRGSDT